VIFSKTKQQFRVVVCIDELFMGFSKNPLLHP